MIASRNVNKMQSQLEQDEQELARLSDMKKNLKVLLVECEKEAQVVLEQMDVSQVSRNAS